MFQVPNGIINLKLLLCLLFFCGSISIFNAIPIQRDNNLENKDFIRKRSVVFQDCGSMYDILQLSIDGCNEVPCKLPVGKMVTVNSEYNDHGEADHVLKHVAYWVLNAVNTKAFVTPEACEGQLCPFRGFEGMAFAANLFVNDSLPALRGQLYWEVYNESDEMVMCYKIPIAITF